MIVNRNIYFAHIPRTAGRFIRDTLIQNGHDVKQYGSYESHYRGKETLHLTYPEYHDFLNNYALKKFSVVREPVDRFISMISKNWMFNKEKIDKMFRSQEDFDQTISNEILNNPSNWFVPQINFVDHNTKIWKFEDNFKDEFVEWMMYNFNIKIDKFGSSDEGVEMNKIILNKEKIKYIQNYYYKDYKLFNYEFKS